MNKVVVVGGAGNFGRVVANTLAARGQGGEILVTSRPRSKAERLAERIQSHATPVRVTFDELDAASATSCKRALIGAVLCIDLAGPFQGRDCTLVRTCAELGCDYLDFSEDVDYSGRVAEVAASAGICVFTSHSTFSATTLLLANRLVQRIGKLEEIRTGLIMATGGGAGVAAMRSLLMTLDRSDSAVRSHFGLTYPDPIGHRRLLVYPTSDDRWLPDVLRISQCMSGIGFTNTTVAPLLMMLRSLGIQLARLLPLFMAGQSVLQRLPRSGMTGSLQVWGRTADDTATVTLVARGNGGDVPCFPAVLTGLRYLRGEKPVAQTGLHWLHEWLSWAEWEAFCNGWGVEVKEV